MTEREKQEFNKGDAHRETTEPLMKKPKIVEPLKKGQGETPDRGYMLTGVLVLEKEILFRVNSGPGTYRAMYVSSSL